MLHEVRREAVQPEADRPFAVPEERGPLELVVGEARELAKDPPVDLEERRPHLGDPSGELRRAAVAVALAKS